VNNVSRIRSIRSLVGGAVIALVFGFSVVTGAPVANAHAEGVASSPVDNTQVASPAQISVTFTENLILEYSYIALFDGAGNPVPQGPATVDASGRVLSSAIPETLAAGIYRVVWNALSVDGHETDGEFSFEVTANPGGDGSSPAEPIAEPTEELPVDPEAEALIAVTRAGDMPQDSGAMTAQIVGWSALGAGVVAAIVVAALVFVRRRRVG
jgi:methionine-rich copper-binding protein CopC